MYKKEEAGISCSMMINIIVYSFFCFLVNVLKYYVTSVEDNFMSIIFCFVKKYTVYFFECYNENSSLLTRRSVSI